MKRANWVGLVITAILVSVCAPFSQGQAVYGSIFGTVTDPSGAAISGATVTVTDVRKGTTDTAQTNESGNYSVTHLIPDNYSVKVEGQGFKVTEQKDVAVSADAGSHVDLQVQIGGASETVEVTGEAPELKTDRADVATTFNERYVEDLPILNRNFTTLELLSPGTQRLVGWNHAATENPQGSQQIFVQGQHFSGTAYELDGTDNQDPILGIIVVNPNLDAVTETKVALQNYDAEFGKAIAGVVTAQTKSGSNQLHGSGFFFRRSDAQQARDPFTQSKPDAITHRFIPQSRWAQFGGTIGGPIIKDKLFFFGDYQGTRQISGISNLLTVPTSTVQTSCNPATNAASSTPGFCNLSEYLAPAGGKGPVQGGGQVYDPNTGDANSGVGRNAFIGNLIPIGRISPQAAAILAAFPAPQNSGVLNNFVGSGSGPFKQNSFDTRMDFQPSQSLTVFGRFSLDYFNLSGQPVLGGVGGPGTGLLGLSGSSITHNYSLATGITKTLSSTLLTDFRFGYFKYNPQTKKAIGGTPMTAFGIPNANTSDPKTAGLGAFLLGQDTSTGENGAPNVGSNAGLSVSSFGEGLGVARCNCPLTESEQQFQFVNNWTKIKGNHQIKFGADIRYAENLRIPSDNNRTGEYNFSPEGTSLAGAGGLDLGTFLLGDVTSFARYVNNPNLPGANNAAERQKRWFFYGQDTFRATSKLTLNYGLRWEIYFPESVNAKGNGGFANITDNGGTGAIRVAGYGGYGLNGNVGNDWHALAPRIGIAYQFTPKTVIRMGYGRSYDIGVFGSNFGHTVTQNLPVLLKQNVDASSLVAGSSAAANIIPIFTLAQGPPLPASFFAPIPANGQIPLNSGTHIRPPTQRLPSVDAWNATLQRQVTNTISAEVAYVGSKGTHGFAGNGPNYDINPKSIAGYGVLSDNQRRPLYPKIPIDLGNYYGNDASSTYNAFEVKVEKRFASGLQFLSHYTFSHAYNYDSNYYAISHVISHGFDDNNRNHVFVVNTVYSLPFGRNAKFMGNSSKALDYLIGGWQITNTTNFSSGLPWTPSTNECGAEEDVGICRPNKGSGSFHVGPGKFDPINHNVTFFTPLPSLSGPFTDPGKGNLGNIGRNTFHGPRGFYSDASIMKNFSLTERVKAQFRMDAFNVFNHPVYAFSANNGSNPCIDCQGGNNGKITDIEQGTTMRELQFAVRFNF